MNILLDKRKKMGYTQKDVASKVGITRQFYTMIESNKRRPSPEVALKIAQLLGFEDEWFKLLEG